MTHTTYDLLSVLDDEIPYPAWMEEDLFGDEYDFDDYRDRYEEDYNEMLMNGGDL